MVQCIETNFEVAQEMLNHFNISAHCSRHLSRGVPNAARKTSYSNVLVVHIFQNLGPTICPKTVEPPDVRARTANDGNLAKPVNTEGV